MMHWVQDHGRVSLTPGVIVGMTNVQVRQMWSAALERANARKAVAKQCKATQAGADPGELKSDKGYYELEDRWENYLSTIPGQNGVPLSYVIRMDDAPDYNPDPAYSNFVGRSNYVVADFSYPATLSNLVHFRETIEGNAHRINPRGLSPCRHADTRNREF